MVQRIKTLKVTFEEVNEECPEYMLQKVSITNSEIVADLFTHLRVEAKEHFIVLHTDSKNKVICQDNVAVGSLNATVVHPREVFKSALLSSASGIVLIHNHPSGDPMPSKEDIAITKRLSECGDLLGIRVLDHIIVGDPKHFSFRNHGLISG